jgi:hypothetical protein
MKKVTNELKVDLNFLKSHTLQPKWYKVFKVFLLLGFLAGYYLWFGWMKTVVFFGVFVLLSSLVHLVYRAKTKKYTQSWLDFVVVEKEGQITQERIGIYYYSVVIINAILSVVISQVVG